MDLLENGTVTMSDIARSTNISLSHVSRIMGGNRRPSLDVASKIAAYLGVTIEELLHALDVRNGGDLPPVMLN